MAIVQICAISFTSCKRNIYRLCTTIVQNARFVRVVGFQ